MAVMIIGSTCVALQGTPAQAVGSFIFGAVGDHGSSANARTVLRWAPPIRTSFSPSAT